MLVYKVDIPVNKSERLSRGLEKDISRVLIWPENYEDTRDFRSFDRKFLNFICNIIENENGVYVFIFDLFTSSKKIRDGLKKFKIKSEVLPLVSNESEHLMLIKIVGDDFAEFFQSIVDAEKIAVVPAVEEFYLDGVVEALDNISENIYESVLTRNDNVFEKIAFFSHGHNNVEIFSSPAGIKDLEKQHLEKIGKPIQFS